MIHSPWGEIAMLILLCDSKLHSFFTIELACMHIYFGTFCSFLFFLFYIDNISELTPIIFYIKFTHLSS